MTNKSKYEAPVFNNKTNQEMIDELNSIYPVSIKHNEDLVDRIHARYPLLEKSQISIIVKAVFVSLRDLLILGKTLNFNTIFFATKLMIFKYPRFNKIWPCLKIQMKTAMKIRKSKD